MRRCAALSVDWFSGPFTIGQNEAIRLESFDTHICVRRRGNSKVVVAQGRFVQRPPAGHSCVPGGCGFSQLFPNSVLVGTVGGTTHGNSLAGNECVDKRIADYLATGVLPERIAGDKQDVSCEALPLPEPTTEEEAYALGRTPLRQRILRSVIRR